LLVFSTGPAARPPDTFSTCSPSGFCAERCTVSDSIAIFYKGGKGHFPRAEPQGTLLLVTLILMSMLVVMVSLLWLLC
jgi:hypothetical protein